MTANNAIAAVEILQNADYSAVPHSPHARQRLPRLLMVGSPVAQDATRYRPGLRRCVLAVPCGRSHLALRGIGRYANWVGPMDRAAARLLRA